MGSDDLFKKRKARTEANAKRRSSSRKPYDRVLIVCEGSKTEPIYLEEMRLHLELDTTNITIDGKCGSSPINVVDHAHSEYLRDRATGEYYDRVYCVFDKDTHSTYDEAIAKVSVINLALKKENKQYTTLFIAIKSVPCFEYWLLLHFTPTTKPFYGTGKKSAADRLIDDLKVYIPDYKKTQEGLYKYSIDNNLLDSALSHSKRIYIASEKSGDDNPSTNIHELVEYLHNLKNNNRS